MRQTRPEARGAPSQPWAGAEVQEAFRLLSPSHRAGYSGRPRPPPHSQPKLCPRPRSRPLRAPPPTPPCKPHPCRGVNPAPSLATPTHVPAPPCHLTLRPCSGPFGLSQLDSTSPLRPFPCRCAGRSPLGPTPYLQVVQVSHPGAFSPAPGHLLRLLLEPWVLAPNV